MKKLLVLFATLFLAAYAYADQYRDDYHHRDSGFENGYSEGYEHGIRDGRSRATFDFRHASEYQQSSCEFRLGYVEGYSDGYFNRPPITRGGYDDHYGGGGYDERGVIVYTDEGFRGYAKSFGPGRYPYLDGRLNDSIESVRVGGNFRVILFDNSNFRGEQIVVDRDSFDLGHFKKKAASMIVEPIGYR